METSRLIPTGCRSAQLSSVQFLTCCFSPVLTWMFPPSLSPHTHKKKVWMERSVLIMVLSNPVIYIQDSFHSIFLWGSLSEYGWWWCLAEEVDNNHGDGSRRCLSTAHPNKANKVRRKSGIKKKEKKIRDSFSPIFVFVWKLFFFFFLSFFADRSWFREEEEEREKKTLFISSTPKRRKKKRRRKMMAIKGGKTGRKKVETQKRVCGSRCSQ